jgi:hypothetical protein
MTVEGKPSPPSRIAQEPKKPAAEETAQDAHRQEEAGTGVDPAALIQ